LVANKGKKVQLVQLIAELFAMKIKVERIQYFSFAE